MYICVLEYLKVYWMFSEVSHICIASRFAKMMMYCSLSLYHKYKYTSST